MDPANYLELLKCYCTKFNWGYRDRYREIDFIQTAFLPLLFIVRSANDYTPVLLLTDRFSNAFPAVLQDCPHFTFESPEETLKSTLSLRFLERFAEPFGLLDLQWQHVNKFSSKPVAYRTTPLYSELLHWDR